MQKSFIARVSEDGRKQDLADHLHAVAQRAASHAGSWGKDFAYVCGLLHDIGKYSQAFQARIAGAKARVDHATAGGKLLYESNKGSRLSILAAYCILGHHGGLPNGGSSKQDSTDEPTLYGRLGRSVEDYSAYNAEIKVPQLLPPNINVTKWRGFDASFFVRMVYSSLIDADWLDSEHFCNLGNYVRGGFESIHSLHNRLQSYIQPFLGGEALNDLNKKRTELLNNCLNCATQPRGLFTLTAPTGSGKTISSLAFALKHAENHGLRRVIYVVPYNTIIEQNAAVFEEILGAENVLRHNSEATYEDYENTDPIVLNKRHSAENWDYPLIITSNVQFFESLFANKPSKCRKLHNIADSVIIFDEAQMIPVPYLIPCVKAIEVLVSQYNCTAVLATATQSALDTYFKTLSLREITEKPQDLYEALRRTRLMPLDKPLTDSQLTKELLKHDSVLCIVNTRRHAQALFTALSRATPLGVYHLSTTMYPAHRRRILDEIRGRLKAGLTCRVISTSLVEAGVDLDFACVYRAQAGLDSIIQAAGRCNREGRRMASESIVYIFDSENHKPPAMIQPNIDAYRQVVRKRADLSDLGSIRNYFEQLFYNLGEERLDEKSVVKRFDDGAAASMSFPLKDVAEQFRLIDNAAQQSIYVLHEVPEICERLRKGERGRDLFRLIGAYAVNLYEFDIGKLLELGAIERLDESVWLLTEAYYDKQMGVLLSPEGGMGLYA